MVTSTLVKLSVGFHGICSVLDGKFSERQNLLLLFFIPYEVQKIDA